MAFDVMAYADTKRRADFLLSAFNNIPDNLRGNVVANNETHEMIWTEAWQGQDFLLSSGNGERWHLCSFVNDPTVPREELIRAMTPNVTELPTRTSLGVITLTDIDPDEEDACFSLPDHLYVSSYAGWTDPALEPKIYQHFFDRYKQTLPVSCGMYVADYDVTNDAANSRIMSDTAFEKWLSIRKQWDLQDLFPKYRRLIQTQEKMNSINKSPSSVAASKVKL